MSVCFTCEDGQDEEEVKEQDNKLAQQRINKDTYVFKSLKSNGSLEVNLDKELYKINVVNDYSRSKTEDEP
jgi:hypothetical protein